MMNRAANRVERNSVAPSRRSRRRATVRSAGGYLFAAVAAAVCLSGTAWAQAPNWPSERPPRPLPSREIKFPPYELRTLPNGLQVVAVLHHEQPAVSMRMLIRA